MKLYTKRGIRSATILGALFLVTVGVLSIRSSIIVYNNSQWVSHTNEVLAQIYKIDLLSSEFARGVRGYALTGESIFLLPYEDAVKNLPIEINKLKELTIDNPNQQKRIEQLEALLKQFEEQESQIITARKNSGTEAAKSRIISGSSENLFNTEQQIFNDMVKDEDVLLKQRDDTLKRNVTLMQIFFVCSGLFGVFFLVYSSQTIQQEMMLATKNQELTQTVEHIQVVNKELEAFTYSVAHDLRAPLRHIDGFTRMLEEECRNTLPESVRELPKQICERVSYMGQLIEAILTLSKIGQSEIKPQVSNLKTILDAAQEELKKESTGRNIEWRIAEMPFVECDPWLVQIVFNNLLSNAIKYTNKKDPAVIEVDCLNLEKEPTIRIRDNGVGFSMKYADKLFGVFQRLHRQEDFEGTGIGLAIVHRIIEKHHGRIWCESEVNKGTSFFFTLGPQK